MFVLIVSGSAMVISYFISHAAPILRARVIQTLSARFKSRVELPDFSVSLANGLAVSGANLKIFSEAEPGAAVQEPPVISVQQFRFETGFRNLFRTPMHVDTVRIHGMVLNLPHHQPGQSGRQTSEASGTRPAEDSRPRWPAQFSIVVDKLVFDDTQVVITHKPGKLPTVLQITKLTMKNVGPGQPMPFEATLINPRPVGNIESQGLFGPFHETEPRDTPVSGGYSFTHADLSTFHGVSGILSSSGNYRGTLGKIEVDGATDTPDFRLATAGHPLNLQTDFHAVVDGTDGDTYLQPVVARFLHSSLTANGKIIRTAEPHGHDVELNVVIDHAEIQDLLQLAVKTEPPVLDGSVVMRTKMSLPPGPENVVDRLELDGSFKILDGTFSSNKIQDRINDLSLRAQGKPKLVKQEQEEDVAVPSDLNGTFRLDNGVMTFSQLEFSVPGVRSDVHGQYSLDGNVFDFHGTLRLKAKLSQLTTGWKSILLKPVDPFFSKDGAGTEVPFRVTGTRSEPHFGLDFGHKDADADQSQAVPAAH